MSTSHPTHRPASSALTAGVIALLVRSPVALRTATLMGLLAASLGAAQASAQVRIYTCVDAQGRTITSDRPIPECADRPQRELSPSGTVRQVIPPTPTAAERAAQEERERRRFEEEQRQAEQRRRERSLLLRFPDEASHNRARDSALAQIDSTISSGEEVVRDLTQQHRKLKQEAEFYKSDPSRMPNALRLQIKDNEQFTEGQRRLLDAQRAERERQRVRFDEELQMLRALWAQQAAGGSGGASATGQRPAVR